MSGKLVRVCWDNQQGKSKKNGEARSTLFYFPFWAQNGKLILLTSWHDIILQDFMEGILVHASSDLSVSVVKANNQCLQIQIHIPYETYGKHLTKSHDKKL